MLPSEPTKKKAPAPPPPENYIPGSTYVPPPPPPQEYNWEAAEPYSQQPAAQAVPPPAQLGIGYTPPVKQLSGPPTIPGTSIPLPDLFPRFNYEPWNTPKGETIGQGGGTTGPPRFTSAMLSAPKPPPLLPRPTPFSPAINHQILQRNQLAYNAVVSDPHFGNVDPNILTTTLHDILTNAPPVPSELYGGRDDSWLESGDKDKDGWAGAVNPRQAAFVAATRERDRQRAGHRPNWTSEWGWSLDESERPRSGASGGVAMPTPSTTNRAVPLPGGAGAPWESFPQNDPRSNPDYYQKKAVGYVYVGPRRA